MGTFVSTRRYLKLLQRMIAVKRQRRFQRNPLAFVRLMHKFDTVLTRQSNLTYKDAQEGRIWVHGVSGAAIQ